MAGDPTALDLVADAFVHCKTIGHVGGAMPIFEKANLTEIMDDGFIPLDDGDLGRFTDSIRKGRIWGREAARM